MGEINKSTILVGHFNMNLSVLRPESGEMMKLVQYDLTGEKPAVESAQTPTQD